MREKISAENIFFLLLNSKVMWLFKSYNKHIFLNIYSPCFLFINFSENLVRPHELQNKIAPSYIPLCNMCQTSKRYFRLSSSLLKWQIIWVIALYSRHKYKSTHHNKDKKVLQYMHFSLHFLTNNFLNFNTFVKSSRLLVLVRTLPRFSGLKLLKAYRYTSPFQVLSPTLTETSIDITTYITKSTITKGLNDKR